MDPDEQPVQAVVTESAEPIYVNEQRDTIEAPPLEVPVVVEAERTVPGPARPDRVAEERGVRPIRRRRTSGR